MTADTCANCNAPVDPVTDPDCHVAILEGKRLQTVECLCASCREGLLERREIEDAAASLHEERSTS